MKLSYNLLKELRDKGFPQEGKNWREVVQLDGSIDKIYDPSQEELLATCGEHFTEIRNLKNLQLYTVHPIDIPDDKTYEAVCTHYVPVRFGHGEIIDIALANLYLALKNPMFGK